MHQARVDSSGARIRHLSSAPGPPSHVAIELSAELAALAWTMISGAASVLYPETVVAGRSLSENPICMLFASLRQTGRSCSSRREAPRSAGPHFAALGSAPLWLGSRIYATT